MGSGKFKNSKIPSDHRPDGKTSQMKIKQSDVDISKQSKENQNGLDLLRAGHLLVSCGNSVAIQWDILLLNILGLLNNTIAYRGEKFVQPCGYEDLNQG